MINHKDGVRVGVGHRCRRLDGGVCVCVELECAGVKVEMSRACCCSVSHADAMSPTTLLRRGKTDFFEF